MIGSDRRELGRRAARCAVAVHDHVLRNHSVGSTWSGASPAPRLWTVMRQRMSSGASLAYSTSTSKYRSSSKMPVSISSYSASTGSVTGSWHEIVVRVRPVRVLVEPALVGVRRQVVEVEVVLLDVLAVIALGVRQPEQPLFENRVVLVPQREREAQSLLRRRRCRRGRPRPTGTPASATGRG